MIDERPACLRYGRHSHNWNFDESTGKAKCINPGCTAELDTRAKISKGDDKTNLED